MARRYSGSCTVYVRWDDRREAYCGSVVAARSGGNKVRWRFAALGALAYLTHAVDSPEAYDNAAMAALSFASAGSTDDRDPTLASDIGDARAYDPDGSTWVGRTRDAAWPPAIFGEVGHIAARLREVRDYIRGEVPETDVRLRILPDLDGWQILSGDAQYDQDHRGYWGASGVDADATDAEIMEVARELIREAYDHWIEDREWSK